MTEPEENHSLTNFTMKGEVSRVVYESDDQSFTILKLVDDKGEEHTVTGSIMGAHDGQTLEVTGKWIKHKEYGRQLKVEAYQNILPTTNEGIEKYLCSGVIPGIGPKSAKAIVNTFGGRTIEVLDNYSSRLSEVAGFGKKKIKMVKEAWADQAERRNIYIYMQGVGITTAYCQKIYKVYGAKSADVVRNNPYQLADEVRGIGFVMADKVAMLQGVEHSDPKRLTAGTLYSLNQLSQLGNTCYPEHDFIQYTADLLEVGMDDAKRGISCAVEKKDAVIDEFSEPDSTIKYRFVYSAGLYAAERELTQQLISITSVQSHASECIANMYTPDGAIFDEVQLSAVEKIGLHPFSIITGGPGVGKTTVVGEIVRRAKAAQLKVMLAAPTGRAAKRMTESCGVESKTIHRLLKWDPIKATFMHGYEEPLICDLLIVDETSMLDILLAVFLFRAVEAGTTVVFVGDVDQLPSVGPGRVLLDLISSGKCAVTHLKKIYRQGNGSRIITNSHLVNSGEMPTSLKMPEGQLTDFYRIDQDDPDKVAELIVTMVKERIPKRFGFNPKRDIQVLTPMNRGNSGTATLNTMLQEQLNGGNKPQFKFGEKTYKVNDKVMQTSNNYDKNVFNGDMGFITEIDIQEKVFIITYEECAVEYNFDEADQINLAYAITVHKSQGSEFPVVIMPMLSQHYMMLQRNLLYTGMTRAKKLLILIGCKKAISMAVNNTRQKPRYSMLLQRLKAIPEL